MSLHPHNISQKTEIMIEHFRDKTMHKIGGEAKAMLVTSSRLHAVRYKNAFDKYIRDKGYKNLKSLVAFSGTVKDDGFEYTEPKLNNGIPESETAKEFDKDEYQILLVANKYQTGFDQPKLHTMFVDKRLQGVNAVQTLSRLNRTYKGIKEDTFVLDFVNEADDIKNAFEPYYDLTKLDSDNIDPNQMYTLYDEIMDSMLIDKADIDAFAHCYYENDSTEEIIAAGDNALSHSTARIENLSKEDKLEFRSQMKRFINLYNLVLQVHPIKDIELHKLNIYLKFLLKRIDVETPNNVDISDKVVLEYYQLENKGQQSIGLIGEKELTGPALGSGSYQEEEKEHLSVIIERLNEKFQTNFSDSAKVAIDQMKNKLEKNNNLKKWAQANSFEDFKIPVQKKFEDTVVESYNENTEFYGKVLNDKDFKEKLMDLIMIDLYQSLRAE